jgi:hypothetical protein
MTAMDDVKDFLAQRRIAFVGVSHDERDFSRAVWKALRERGYELVPVNPHAEAIDGEPAVPSLAAVAEPVDGVLIMTPATASAEVVREAIRLGIPRVWLHRGAGQGAVSDEAVELARAAELRLVDGQCPMMFLDNHGFGHDVHAFFKKLGGTYPR